MKRYRHRRRGFAILLVMMLVAMAVIVGVSYVSTSSVQLLSAANTSSASRAKYLSESGIEHCFYILQSNPSALVEPADTTLGPFYADQSGEGYVFRATETDREGYYLLTAESTVGGVSQTSSVEVYLATLVCYDGFD